MAESEKNNESIKKDIEEEKKKISDLGLEEMSKASFERLSSGTLKKKKNEPKFRGF